VKNTGIEARWLRVGDRVQLFRNYKPAGYAVVRLAHPDKDNDKRVVVYFNDEGGNPYSRASYRLSEWVVVEWVPGIHERDLVGAK
jgi:hypothetical protein